MDIIKRAFIQYRQWLVNYVCKRVGDYADAEDIVQDAFVRLMELQVGVREESVRALLFTTCHHLVLDRLRRRVLAERTNIYMYAYAEMAVENTEQSLRVKELKEQERCAISMMPPKRREVYCLARFEGRNIDEIAANLNVSRRTVEAHLFAGRKEVRTRLKAYAS